MNISTTLKTVAFSALLFGCRVPSGSSDRQIGRISYEDPDQKIIQRLESVLQKVHPLIYHELQGRIRINTAYDAGKLNAYYAYRNRTIIIDCTPDRSQCTDFGVVYHEVGHHIYPILSDQARTALARGIQDRLQEPDAAEFRARMKDIKEARQKIRELSTTLSPARACSRIFDIKRHIRHYYDTLTELRARKKNLPKAVEELERSAGKEEEQIERYRLEFPSCTTENIARDVRALHPLFNCYIRHLNQSNEPLPAPCAIPAMNPSVHFEDDRLFDEGDLDHLSTRIDTLYREIDRLDPGSFATAMRSREIESKLGLWSNSFSYLYHLREITEEKSEHDESDEEQFCAAVASLYTVYTGPVTTAPMLFRLSDPLLENLAAVKYKGETIFASPVQAYKTHT